MKRLWTIIVGILTFGLVYPSAHLVVKGHQKEIENNTEPDRTPKILLFAVIGVILMFAFSMEIKEFLTQLF